MNTPTYGSYDLLCVSVHPPLEHAVITTSEATISYPPVTQVQSSVPDVKGNCSTTHAQFPSHKFHWEKFHMYSF